jgi:hypothetical protein
VDSHGVAYREVLAWLALDINAMQMEKVLHEKVGDGLWKDIVKVRENLEVIFDMDDQPIPFVYVHLIYLISTVYLPLMAYTLAYTVSVEAQSPGVEMVACCACSSSACSCWACATWASSCRIPSARTCRTCP